MAKRLSPNIFAHLLVVAGNDLGNRKNISVRNKMHSTKNLLFMKMVKLVEENRVCMLYFLLLPVLNYYYSHIYVEYRFDTIFISSNTLPRSFKS